MHYLFINFDQTILCISDSLDYQTNGNYLVQNGTLAIPPLCIQEMVEYNKELPEDIETRVYKYIDGELIVPDEPVEE